MKRNHHRSLAAARGARSCGVLAPAASATITPAATLTQTATVAGTNSNVTLDLKFAPTGTDSPKDLTVTLPPGLLANAAIDGGACLTSHDGRRRLPGRQRHGHRQSDRAR